MPTLKAALFLISLALQLCHQSFAAVTMFQRLSRPDLSALHYPSHFTSETWQAMAKRPYVGCILHHGLGNNLFAIAACTVYAKRINQPLVVGFWQEDSNQAHQLNHSNYSPWGGHPSPLSASLTFGHVFSNIPWKNNVTLLPDNCSTCSIHPRSLAPCRPPSPSQPL